MKVTSAHFNPKIQPYLRHNDRTNKSSPNIHQDLTHLNEYTKSSSEVLREIDKLYDEAMQKLKGTKGKRTPKERSFHEAIFEIAEDTTMEQCQKLADEICELTGFRTLQIAIHRDEGHKDENGNFITHYHAHAVFFTLDKESGKQLARQEASLTKFNLSKIQDLASEIFGLQRGEKNSQKQYVSDYREYKKIQQSKTEAKKQANDLIKQAQAQGKKQIEDLMLGFVKWKQKIEQELKDKEQELANKEQELAQKEQKIQEELKSIDEKQEWILKQKEELNKQERNLQKQKQEILGNAEDAYEALRGEYNSRYSTFKNIITFGKHGRQLAEEFKKAENFLANQTDKAIQEVNRRLQSSNHLINEYIEETDRLHKEKRELEKKLGSLQFNHQKELENANNTIKELREQVKELKDKYEPQQEQVIKITKTKTQAKESRGFSL